jgi:hypothetical protein
MEETKKKVTGEDVGQVAATVAATVAVVATDVAQKSVVIGKAAFRETKAAGKSFWANFKAEKARIEEAKLAKEAAEELLAESK